MIPYFTQYKNKLYSDNLQGLADMYRETHTSILLGIWIKSSNLKNNLESSRKTEDVHIKLFCNSAPIYPVEELLYKCTRGVHMALGT